MSSEIYKVSGIKRTDFKQNESFKHERTASEVYSVIDIDDYPLIDFGLNEGISPEINIRYNQVYYYLKNRGIDDLQIAAIMGNIKQEAGDYFDPCENTERLLNEKYPSNRYLDQRTGAEIVKFDMSMAGNSQYKAASRKRLLESHAIPLYGGIGLVQWTGGLWDEATKSWVPAKNDADRKALFLNWCNSNNLKWYEMDTQLEYIFKEYNGWDYKDEFESLQTVDEATEFFCNKFENPQDDTLSTRQAYARDFYSILNNSFGGTPDPGGGFGYVGNDVMQYINDINKTNYDASKVIVSYNKNENGNEDGTKKYLINGVVYAETRKDGGIKVRANHSHDVNALDAVYYSDGTKIFISHNSNAIYGFENIDESEQNTNFSYSNGKVIIHREGYDELYDAKSGKLIQIID